MPDMALCRNQTCPSREHCYRFTAEPSCHQVYAQFTVRPKEDRCDYYIPDKMEGGKVMEDPKTLRAQLDRAEELLQELADAVKGDTYCKKCGIVVRPYEINELHYKVIAFLCRCGRVYP